MISAYHIAPSLYLEATRYIDDGRGRPVRRPSRLTRIVRHLTSRTTTAGLPRWVDITPASAAR